MHFPIIKTVKSKRSFDNGAINCTVSFVRDQILTIMKQPLADPDVPRTPSNKFQVLWAIP